MNIKGSTFLLLASLFAVCIYVLHVVLEISSANILYFFATIVSSIIVYKILLLALKMTRKIFKYRFFIVGSLSALAISVGLPFLEARIIEKVEYNHWEFAFRFVIVLLTISGISYLIYRHHCKNTRFKKSEDEFVILSDIAVYDNGDFAKKGRLILTNKRLSVVAIGKGKLLFNKKLTDLPEDLEIIKPNIVEPGGLRITGTDNEITVAYPKFWKNEIMACR